MEVEEKREKEWRGDASDRASSPKKASRLHRICQRRLEIAINTSSYVRYMLEAMEKSGCKVNVPKHLVCEPCGPMVAGGYDPNASQIVLCENNIYSQKHMNDTLTHELIHTLDYCRAEIDWSNLDHLACTEIRAANLSGECFFSKETFTRMKFGWKKHHQVCVRERALKSILCIRDVSEAEAQRAVDRVFDGCFSDTYPFERVPP